MIKVTESMESFAWLGDLMMQAALTGSDVSRSMYFALERAVQLSIDSDLDSNRVGDVDLQWFSVYSHIEYQRKAV